MWPRRGQLERGLNLLQLLPKCQLIWGQCPVSPGWVRRMYPCPRTYPSAVEALPMKPCVPGRPGPCVYHLHVTRRGPLWAGALASGSQTLPSLPFPHREAEQVVLRIPPCSYQEGSPARAQLEFLSGFPVQRKAGRGCRTVLSDGKLM